MYDMTFPLFLSSYFPVSFQHGEYCATISVIALSTRSTRKISATPFYDQKLRKIENRMEERPFNMVAILRARKLFTTGRKDSGVGLLLTGLILFLVVHHYVCFQVEIHIGLESEQLKE
jgi:hypothetical protein